MGFFNFSFLTRKTSSGKNPAPTLKAQAYDTTVAAPPPILGTYPVAGNGPNVLDQLQRAARKRSEAQLSVIDPGTPTSLSIPSVPRFRGSVLGRPSTAPNAPNKVHPRAKSVSNGSQSGRQLAPDKYAIFRSEAPPPVPPLPQISKHHRRISSLDSCRSRGFVDILDAQDEIKPSHFRSRVQATGTREYGEDVAERNIGANAAVDLRSPPLRGFYALNSTPLPARPSGRSASIQVNAFHATSEFEALDETAPAPIIAKGELSKEEWAFRFRHRESRDLSTARPKTSGVTTWGSFSRTSMFSDPEDDPIRALEQRPKTHHSSPNPGQLDTSPVNRRRSFNAFASSPVAVRSKPRPLSLNPSLSNFSNRSVSPPPVPSIPLSRLRRNINLEDESIEARIPTAKRQDDRPRTRHSQGSKATSSIEHHRSRQARKKDSLASLSQRTSSVDSFRFGIGKVDVEGFAESAFDSPAPSPHIPGRSSRFEHQSIFSPESNQSLRSYYGHARGEHSHPLSRPSSSSSFDLSYTRTRSLGGGSASGKAKLDDITEHIPIRTSSLGQSAPPCITPTTTLSSGQSSSLFPRPQSQHTANTSIDIPVPPLPQDQKRHAGDGIASGGDADAYFTAEESDGAGGVKRKDVGDGNALIPDFSDGSLSDAASGGESGLLFDEMIYGDLGGGLPGLFDALSGPSSPTMPRTPTASSVKRATQGKRSISTPNKKEPQRQPKLRHAHSTPFSYSRGVGASGYGSFTDEDSLSDSELEYLRQKFFSRMPRMHVNNAPRKMSVHGVVEEEEEEEVEEEDEGKEEKVDAKTAARLRKEIKSRKRRTTTAHSRRARRPVDQKLGDDDEGHAADTEDSKQYRRKA